jgi:hypothetical protein
MLTKGDDSVPAKHFFGKGIYVRQMLPVSESRKPIVANDGIYLCLSLLHDLWVNGHSKEE